MNIFNKIKQDHDEAREMMERIISTQEAEPRLKLFNELKIAILAHAKSEERTFYKALKTEGDACIQKEVPHMREEHRDAEELFAELEGMNPESSLWWERFGELRKALMHHMEEEEKEVFKDARKEIPSEEAKALGEKMEQLEEREKEKLMKEVEVA